MSDAETTVIAGKVWDFEKGRQNAGSAAILRERKQTIEAVKSKPIGDHLSCAGCDEPMASNGNLRPRWKRTLWHWDCYKGEFSEREFI